MVCAGSVLRASCRCGSLEECDDGFCEDVIAITGDHMGRVYHVDILGVRALLEETLGTHRILKQLPTESNPIQHFHTTQ